MNFEIIISLQPGESLISHGSIQFSSSNVVVFAVGSETMNKNNKTKLANLQYFLKCDRASKNGSSGHKIHVIIKNLIS